MAWTKGTLSDAIDSVHAHILYWNKQVQAGAVSANHAEDRYHHFIKVGKQAHADFEAAKKAGKQKAMAEAKARTQRAHRKAAYWLEVWDDKAGDRHDAVVRRKHQVKKIRALRKIMAEMENATVTGPNHRVMLDGKPCADWLAQDLLKARNAGLWSGYLVSGVRTSAQSVALCWAMCNNPSCPGMCAGTASRHNCDDCAYPKGAADVTDYYRCKAASDILNLRYTNNLPNDRVHMSYDGH